MPRLFLQSSVFCSVSSGWNVFLYCAPILLTTVNLFVSFVRRWLWDQKSNPSITLIRRQSWFPARIPNPTLNISLKRLERRILTCPGHREFLNTVNNLNPLTSIGTRCWCWRNHFPRKSRTQNWVKNLEVNLRGVLTISDKRMIPSPG